MKRIIALIIMLLILVGVIVLVVIDNSNKKVITDIKEFEYTSSGGMDMNGNTIYRIKCDKECIATIKKPHELEKTNVKVDQETIDKLVEIFTEYNVSSWDGFDRVDQYVLDGSSFSFKVVTKDKKTISAHGYMKYPNNYFKVISEISDIFEELDDDGKAI